MIQSLESTIAVCTHADGRGALAYGPVPGALRGHRTLTPGEGPVRCLRYTPGARVGACPMSLFTCAVLCGTRMCYLFCYLASHGRCYMLYVS